MSSQDRCDDDHPDSDDVGRPQGSQSSSFDQADEVTSTETEPGHLPAQKAGGLPDVLGSPLGKNGPFGSPAPSGYRKRSEHARDDSAPSKKALFDPPMYKTVKLRSSHSSIEFEHKYLKNVKGDASSLIRITCTRRPELFLPVKMFRVAVYDSAHREIVGALDEQVFPLHRLPTDFMQLRHVLPNSQVYIHVQHHISDSAQGGDAHREANDVNAFSSCFIVA